MSEPVAWRKQLDTGNYLYQEDYFGDAIPLYTHPVKEQDDYCKAYWGNDNKFVDVFLPNSETEVIRFWNNTHPVKELTDEEIMELQAEYGIDSDLTCHSVKDFVSAILRKAQEK